jgi:hypothetical protein
MTYSSVNNMCDYMTVFFTPESKIQSQIYEFDIPRRFFSNSRGSLCTVQVVSGSAVQTQNDCTMAFQLVDSSRNGFTVTDNVRVTYPGTTATAHPNTPPITGPTIAVLNEKINNIGGLIVPTGEYIISALPHKIRIKITAVANERKVGTNYWYSSVIPVPAQFAGLLVLKFTYYDAVESAVNMLDHQNYRFI